MACEDFEIREKCKVITFNHTGYGLYAKYKGEVSISKQGLRFIGKKIRTAKETEIFCEGKKLPMVSNTLNRSFDFYLIDDYYEFVLEEGIRAVKCSMAINEIHKYFEGESDADRK
jgi:hypothetical protein